jgi:hypothetical protein
LLCFGKTVQIVLKITGGVRKGEMTESGKLLLTSHRKSFKQFTVKMNPRDGREITVTFVSDASVRETLSSLVQRCVEDAGMT